MPMCGAQAAETRKTKLILTHEQRYHLSVAVLVV